MTLRLFLLLSHVVSVFSAELYLYLDDPDSKAILEHTDQNDFEASTKPRVVEFYSPYCG